MKLKKIVLALAYRVKLGLKIAWRLFWLFVGIHLLQKLYILVESYLNGTFSLAGTPGSLTDFSVTALLSIVISSYAFYYAIAGRLLWTGIFVWLLVAIGVGTLAIAGETLYTATSFGEIRMVHGLCCLAFLFLSFSFSRMAWLKYKWQALVTASGILAISGTGLLLYALGAFLLGDMAVNCDTGQAILPLFFFTFIFLGIFVDSYTTRQDSSKIYPSSARFSAESLCSEDSVCLGAWSDYYDDLEEDARSSFMHQMAEETKVAVKELQLLRTYAKQPAQIISLQEDCAEIAFYTQNCTQSFTVNRAASSLLFQPLLLFVITAEQITLHRTIKQALLYADKVKTSGNHIEIYDALGHEYQLLSDSEVLLQASMRVQKLPALIPIYPAKAQELESALLIYLNKQRIIPPSEPGLSSLVSMMIFRFGYA